MQTELIHARECLVVKTPCNTQKPYRQIVSAKRNVRNFYSLVKSVKRLRMAEGCFVHVT